MPLSPPASRRHVHTRAITLRGYLREDGLVDIEATLTDTRPAAERRADGSMREAGAPVHDLLLRVTITTDREMVACEAAMESTPFDLCPGAAPNMARLAGLRIEPGFLRRAQEAIGGGGGCTHLRELLQQVATVAVQTLYSLGTLTDAPHRLRGHRPPLLNSCFAWDESGEMVRARFPEWWKAAATA